LPGWRAVAGSFTAVNMRKIIGVTQVKNEEWILDRFLSVTSGFADHIIVTDQQSTDGSRSICTPFTKVHLISNDSPIYDEAHRQKLLLTEARRMSPGKELNLHIVLSKKWFFIP
jgi:hypothetical protein